MPSHDPSTSRSRVDLALDISDLVLSTIQNAASISTIPFLKESAELALGILNVVQGTRDNQDGFRCLAQDSCGLVYAILQTFQNKIFSDSDFDHVRELLGTLTSIEKFTRKKLSRGLFLRTIKNKSDYNKIQQYRGKLQQSLNLFDFKSTMSIHETVVHISKQQEVTIAALGEGKFARKKEEIQVTDSKGEKLEKECLKGDKLETQEKEKQVSEAIKQHEPEVVYTPTPPVSSKNPFRQPQLPMLPYIQSSHGTFTMTSISGNYTITDATHHTTNTNSCNTTTTITTGSNNDSSIRVHGVKSP